MGLAIRRAGADDREAAAQLLDRVFHDDPVSSWIFPDVKDRRVGNPMMMGAFVDMALADGYVDIAEDGSAVALWMSMPAGGAHGDESADGPAEFRKSIDPDNERIEQIVRILDESHPTDRPHEYLQLIAVSTELHGQGRGADLISNVLDRCDRDGLHAYLEASSLRSRRLYERLGFVFTGTTIDLPGGPHMYPMWREPQAQRQL
ncbi:GNAT family N-acetyltransferase [Streptomyces sp. CA-111067]|uniref:GNAT family N-acetyltransferase n=1 Tax=Streptomyces sp. CA-111067 TaxID=3240046 RepID=UPI003D96A861